MVSTVPVFLIYFLLASWILVFIYTFSRQLTCMVGMMGAMTVGMTTGLGLGTLLMAELMDKIFQTTIASMLFGSVMGIIAGMPISLMAVIDGLLSGMMGGMMGAMLIVMLPFQYVAPTLKIIAVLCSGTLFLLLLMMQDQVNVKFLKQKSFLLSKPYPMFGITILLLLLIQFAPPNAIKPYSASNLNPQLSSPHTMPMPMPAVPGPQTSATQKVVVDATEFSFSPNHLKLIPDEQTTIVLENTGKLEHDFEIVGTDIHVHAKPGTSSKITFSLDQPGIYKAVCTLPGHKEAGMIAVVKVS